MVPLIKPNQTVLFQGGQHHRLRSRPWRYQQPWCWLCDDGLLPSSNRFIPNTASSSSTKASVEIERLTLGPGWTADCIDLKPDWVSILIGINDTWRRYDSNEATSVEAYKEHYQHILERTKNELSANIVILEPFVLPCPPDRIAWREDLDPKIQVARELAREFNALYVPYDGLFASASTKAPSEFWAADGVHPSSAGHALMAREWLRAVSAIC